MVDWVHQTKLESDDDDQGKEIGVEYRRATITKMPIPHQHTYGFMDGSGKVRKFKQFRGLSKKILISGGKLRPSVHYKE